MGVENETCGVEKRRKPASAVEDHVENPAEHH